MKEKQYCDNCGDLISKNKGVVYSELPFDIESANQGESAIICQSCNNEFVNKSV